MQAAAPPSPPSFAPSSFPYFQDTSPPETDIPAEGYEWKKSLAHDMVHAVAPGEQKALCIARASGFNEWLPAEPHMRRCPRCIGKRNRLRRAQGLPEACTMKLEPAFRAAGIGSGVLRSDGGFAVYPPRAA